MKLRLFLFGLALAHSISADGDSSLPFNIEPITIFDEPWAMAFLPDNRMLVTEKKGQLLLVDQTGEKKPFYGVPDVGYGGQGGLGDVALHPNFEENSTVYLSYVESSPDGTRGAAVGRGTINLDGRRPIMSDFNVIWRQYPKMIGYGHYGHRLMFDEKGFLWITSGADKSSPQLRTCNPTLARSFASAMTDPLQPTILS